MTRKILLCAFIILIGSGGILRADDVYYQLKDKFSRSAVDAYSLLNKVDTTFNNDEVIDQVAAQKLFILNNYDYNLWNKIFNTTDTKAGKVVSQRLLLTPNSNFDVIQNRQNLIKYLEFYTDIYQKSKNLLAFFSKHEYTFNDIWSELPDYIQERINSLSMPNILENYNASPIKLGILQWCKRMKDIVYPVVYSLTSRGIAGGFMEWLRTKKDGNLQKSLTDGVKKRFTMFGKTYYSLINPYMFKADLDEHIKEMESPFWGTLTKAAVTIEDASFLYKTYMADKARQENNGKLLSYLKNQIDVLYDILTEVKRFYDNCKNIKEFNQGLTSISAIRKLFVPEQNYAIDDFLNKVKELREKTVSSKIFEGGYVISAYKILQTLKHRLLTVLEFVGELDTYCVLAKLIGSNKNDRLQPYNFVQLTSDTKPHIKMHGFHNPIVQNNKTVNDIEISSGKHILLEGPNASGKSTITRALAYNFILIHCFGIIAAQSGSSSVFSKFISYANIKEVPERGLSGFDAQLHEMLAMQETIEIHEAANRAIFCFLDEPLNGTMEEAGAKELNEFCKFMTQKKNACCLLATHYNGVIPDKAFVPYYMDCNEIESNRSFNLTYLMKKGKHPWWYTDKEKRKRYINWMSKRALDNVIFRNKPDMGKKAYPWLKVAG